MTQDSPLSGNLEPKSYGQFLSEITAPSHPLVTYESQEFGAKKSVVNFLAEITAPGVSDFSVFNYVEFEHFLTISLTLSSWNIVL